MDFIRDMWDDSRAITIFFGALILTVLGIIALFVFSLIGHANGIHEGSVIGKGHQDAYSTIQCSSYDGKTTTCIPVFYPESWSVTISKDGEQNSFDVSQSAWTSVKEGYYLTFDGERLETVKAQ
jgi:hypothetical protein